MSETEPLTCYNHPNRETVLRCNRCEQPICIQCAVLTPTGYRCKQCLKIQQKVFITTKWQDYPVAILTAGILSALGCAVMMMVGQLCIMIPFLIGPSIGFAIAEAVRFLVQRRRSEWLFRAAAAAGGLAVLPYLLPVLFNILAAMASPDAQGSGLQYLLYALSPLLYSGIYLATVVPAIYYRMKGIRLK